MFLERKPGRTSFDVVAERGSITKTPLLANVLDEGRKGADGAEFVKDPRFADSVCAICDNGGDILWCKGSCLRSFHATAGTDEYCESLGYSTAQVEALPIFLCDNCRYKQHQCFACGKLGSSDKTAGAEVFPCASSTCGYFYHPKCVAQLLFRESETKATEFQKKVAAGESFTCPIHKCTICNKRENHGEPKLQFAICRRCPTSYHRKCLPRKIVFEDSGEGVFQRAWDGLLANRILMYCMKHKIDEALRTPIRNHIIFPKSPEKKNKIKIKLKKKISDDLPMEQSSVISCKLKGKHSIPDGSSLGSGRIDTKLKERTGSDHCKASLKDKTKYSVCPVSPKPIKKKFCSSFPVADSETRKRLKSLMDDVSSSLTLENVTEKLTVPSTHAYFPRYIDKRVTLGTMECSVEAIKTALQKLEAGGSIDEAKKLCPPSVLKEMLKWRKNLNVYLAPFLHGMRYTSFGRHFTKVDKLKEIVDKLQWYVESGDTIVDFCCGANDFSTLMKEKLDTAGKRCSFRNYDIIQPKNNFKFERKDWMTVEPKELPEGSRLIMGLNPPFGVRAALANMFIDRALKFCPKILILIVPKETERLDKKDPHYDLIWEDCDKLSAKSFYLPGSIDMDEKQMEQWNLNSPPLYLWSRPDWTAKHKVIALENGHIVGTQRVITSDDNGPSTEPTFNNRDEERVSTPGASELKSLNKKKPEPNLESFKDSEELYELLDMKSSSVHGNGRGSTFGVCQNREELENGEMPDELAHTKDIPADASGNMCTFEDVGAINQSESVTSHRTTYFPAAVLPGASSRIYSGPGGFAPGPVPPSLRKSSSCGWIDD